MSRIGRNIPCPCGSGRKYKACCLPNGVKADPTENPLLLEAIECFRYGYYEGAVQRCEKLESLSLDLEIACSSVAWLSRVCSGQECHHEVARKSSYTKRIIESGPGGQAAAELSWLYFDCWKGEHWKFPNGATLEQKGPFQQVLSFIENQHGVLAGHHPTAILALAELATADSATYEIARNLLCCSLSWRTPYAEVADVEHLAELMVKLRAPVALWADWAAVFLKHVKISQVRDQESDEIVASEDFCGWAAEQNRESESVLKRVLSIGPEQLIDIIRGISPHVGGEELMAVLGERDWPMGKQGTYAPIAQTWHGKSNIKTRYVWYDMLEDHEQGFVTNGDWALFCTPTVDYSMALAQWWRLIESVFGRIVTRELGKLYDENPGWLDADRTGLSKKDKQCEAVFLDKLASPQSRRKMTLSDILLVLEKCVVKPRHGTACRSMLRSKATQFFSKHSLQLIGAIQGDATRGENQRSLTRENIDWFRNRASHVKPIDQIDASVGRVVAKKIIDALFQPQLEGWGFIPSIPVFYNDGIVRD